MKPFSLYGFHESAARSQYSNTCPETKIKGNEIAKFLCLRCRCLGACCKVNGVSFSSFVVPIYAAALANSPDGASRISQFRAGQGGDLILTPCLGVRWTGRFAKFTLSHFSLNPAAIQLSAQVFPVVARLIRARVQTLYFQKSSAFRVRVWAPGGI